MSAKKEDLYDIGNSIARHRRKEINENICNLAVGRYFCECKSSLYPEQDGIGTYWLVNREYKNRTEPKYRALKGDGKPIYKNTLMGGFLIAHSSGTHSYQVKNLCNLRKGAVNDVEVTIYNRSTFSPTEKSAKEIVITAENQSYSYQTLEELLREEAGLVSRLDELKKKQEESIKTLKVAEEKAKEEEKERLLAENLRKKAEEDQKAIQELESKLVEAHEKVARTQSFVREDAQMRQQHILDGSQEYAKRSHLFDGVPVVIEGGPGTGKTTTMIQRLKFLISETALTEHVASLTTAQIKEVSDPLKRDSKWLYFSPTEKLQGYLRQNMIEEELKPNEENTTILKTYCKKMLGAYRLYVPENNGPFKLFRSSESDGKLILDAKVALTSFERFLVRKIAASLLAIAKIQTSGFAWHSKALSIKAYCQKAENVKDIAGLMSLLNSMQQNESLALKENDKTIGEIKNKLALVVLNAIIADEPMCLDVKKLFAKWQDDEEEFEEDVDDDGFEDSDEVDVNISEFKPLLYGKLKSLLYHVSLNKIDGKQKFTKKETELYKIVSLYVDAQNLIDLGQLAWFAKTFAKPCKGIAINVLNQIPKIYKEFRKELIKQGATCYDQKLLQAIASKEQGKRIHREELELLVGFINNLIFDIYKKSKLRFESLSKHKYVEAYMGNVKPVIGVDEATDYSLIDYYFIASFRHYEYSTITLCGDIMQGLNDNGITSWEELKGFVLPGLEVFELRVSYRQTPTLLELSKRLYKDDQGKEAPYHTNQKSSESEAVPLCFISDEMEEKTKWIAKRICEVYKRYGNKLPSVAILVGDEVDIDEMIEIIKEQDFLNGFEVYNCSDNRNASVTKCVRIFRLSEVKGMEFEVVFFYDIDEALRGNTHKMMQRYLYVGVSRATSHLAATFTKKDGNEDVIKYFDTTKKNWK